MKRILIIITCIGFIYSSFAQNGGFTGMGNSSVMLYDFWAIQNNQAGLADIDSIEIGANYNYNYQIWQTGSQTLGMVIPTKSGNFAFGGYRYGYADFAEHEMGLAYARHLGKMFSASVSFNYIFYTQSQNLQYRGALLFQVGIISKPIENLQIGLHIYNPGRVKLKDYDDQPVPTVIRFGAGYYFSPQILLTAETEKDIDKENRFKAGLQYEIINDFFVRTGFQTHPNQFSLGLGYRFGGFTIDLAAVTHESLPISTQVSFKYAF